MSTLLENCVNRENYEEFQMNAIMYTILMIH